MTGTRAGCKALRRSRTCVRQHRQSDTLFVSTRAGQRGGIDWDAIEDPDLIRAKSRHQRAKVAAPAASHSTLNWRVVSILASLMVWFLAAMIIPIPKNVDAGDEAAARILAFVAGTVAWLLVGSIIHLCVRSFSPNAGLSTIALGVGLAAGSNLAGAAAHFAPVPYRDRLTDTVAAADIAIRNGPQTLARAVIDTDAIREGWNQVTGGASRSGRMGFASVPTEP